MENLEKRVDRIEKELSKQREEINKIQTEINGSLSNIQNDLTEIKQCIKDNNKIDDLKNGLIEKDVERNTARIQKLENNQNKLVWSIIVEIIGLVGAATLYFLKIQ